MRAALLTAAVLTLMAGSGKTKKYLVETEQHSDKKPHRYGSPHTQHQKPHRGGGSQNKEDYDCIHVEQTKRARLSFLHISI